MLRGGTWWKSSLRFLAWKSREHICTDLCYTKQLFTVRSQNKSNPLARRKKYRLADVQPTSDFQATRPFIYRNQRQLSWFGHVCHHDTLAKIALNGTLADGRRRRGQPRKSWKDNIKEWRCQSMSSLLCNADGCGRWGSHRRRCIYRSRQWVGLPPTGVS